MSELHAVAHKMVEKGKGILAADESTPTCTKRFASINTDSTTESRNFYRNMLFTTEDIEKYKRYHFIWRNFSPIRIVIRN